MSAVGARAAVSETATARRPTDTPTATTTGQTARLAYRTPREGEPQPRATISVPNGEPFVFEADFPPPMGGTGSAPNPLAYCFRGGLACYAMTFAQRGRAPGRATALREGPYRG